MKSPFKVTSIDYVVLHVKDLACAKKFYVELLGMELKRENSWQAFVRCGSQLVGLLKSTRERRLTEGMRSTIWRFASAPVSKERSKVFWRKTGLR